MIAVDRFTIGVVVPDILLVTIRSFRYRICLTGEHKKRIVNTKVIPGEECVHGHHLVVMDMHLKVMKYRKNHQGLHKVQPRIKVWKLKKQEIRKAYLEKLQERDIDIEDSVRVEKQWDKVEKAMTEVAATVL